MSIPSKAGAKRSHASMVTVSPWQCPSSAPVPPPRVRQVDLGGLTLPAGGAGLPSALVSIAIVSIAIVSIAY